LGRNGRQRRAQTVSGAVRERGAEDGRHAARTPASGRSGVLVIRGERGAVSGQKIDQHVGDEEGRTWFRVGPDRRRRIPRMEFAVCGCHQLVRADASLCHLDALAGPPAGRLAHARRPLVPTEAPDRLPVAIAAMSMLAEVDRAASRLRGVSWTTRRWLDAASRPSLRVRARRLLASPWRCVPPFVNRTDERELGASPKISLKAWRTITRARCSRRAVARAGSMSECGTGMCGDSGNPLPVNRCCTGERGAGAQTSGRECPPRRREESVDRIEDQYRRRIAALPPVTRRLMLLADSRTRWFGDATLVWPGGPQTLGLRGQALEPDVDRAVARD